jgi:hypothetical protein
MCTDPLAVWVRELDHLLLAFAFLGTAGGAADGGSTEGEGDAARGRATKARGVRGPGGGGYAPIHFFLDRWSLTSLHFVIVLMLAHRCALTNLIIGGLAASESKPKMATVAQ